MFSPLLKKKNIAQIALITTGMLMSLLLLASTASAQTWQKTTYTTGLGNGTNWTSVTTTTNSQSSNSYKTTYPQASHFQLPRIGWQNPPLEFCARADVLPGHPCGRRIQPRPIVRRPTREFCARADVLPGHPCGWQIQPKPIIHRPTREFCARADVLPGHPCAPKPPTPVIAPPLRACPAWPTCARIAGSSPGCKCVNPNTDSTTGLIPYSYGNINPQPRPYVQKTPTVQYFQYQPLVK